MQLHALVLSGLFAAGLLDAAPVAQVYPPPSFSLSAIAPKPTNTFVLESSLSRSTIVLPTPPATYSLPPKPTWTPTVSPPKPTKSSVALPPKPTATFTVEPTKPAFTSPPKPTATVKPPKPTVSAPTVSIPKPTVSIPKPTVSPPKPTKTASSVSPTKPTPVTSKKPWPTYDPEEEEEDDY
ncbi:hypothetical protein VTL71DRAFT_2377 [Oculimacula yallundae]|uniref:Uncharacterized protein n=1 Tax=Oculimacula yallundae TaxID=86028 RepID=A0ABR4CA24_9HELO